MSALLSQKTVSYTLKLIGMMAAAILFVTALSGCGDRSELPERAFVMGVGIDESEAGKLLLTFQIYKPSQSIATKGNVGLPYINVRTTDDSVMEAIRDVTNHLGRKAQFSHMRVILISDTLVRKIPVAKLLEMFYRDHESRLTCSVIVTRGPTFNYFSKRPLIENTVSQQYYLSEEQASQNSGKSVESNLLKLALQVRSATGNATLPFLETSTDETGKDPRITGIAVLRKGLMVGQLKGYYSEGLLMLTNKYKSGSIELPCPDKSAGKSSGIDESVEVVSYKVQKTVKLKGDQIHVNLHADAKVAAIELSCSTISNDAEETAFEKRIADQIKQQMENTLNHIVAMKVDLLGIGNQINRHHPALWKKWKPDWPNRFAGVTFTIDTHTLMVTHGTTTGKPLLEDEPQQE
ncbi:Ger(x)C family spore germination protein [Paenibacillus sepulcri]|uniref:Ger(X)C family spore germination protein n=1 Tax=Paenibacillus sepulcri TaxID=359917 RepID=A0ABS7C345_9BACL|nr:Ger(x)C family spore germination protein [Paenibacillus sepulcri]